MLFITIHLVDTLFMIKTISFFVKNYLIIVAFYHNTITIIIQEFIDRECWEEKQ